MNIKYLNLIFLFSFLGTYTFGQSMYQVKFKDQVYLPEENVASFSFEKVQKAEIVANRIYRFVQFYEAPTKEDITKMEQKGIRLLGFIPSNTYIVSLPTSLTAKALSQAGVRSIWKMDAQKRMSEEVQTRSLPDWAIEKGQALLIVEYFKDIDQALVVESLEMQDIRVMQSNGVNNYLQVSIPLDRLEEIAQLPYIAGVEPILPPATKDDRRGRSLHRVNKLDPNIMGARNYTGKGINILVRDDGAVFEHIDFKGRLDQKFAGASFGGHGDGVAGIIGGAGNLDPINKGMAHGSTIHVINYSANFLDETLSLFVDDDVIVTNSSYSNGCNAGYTNTARIVDQQMYDNPTLMHVFSAGNNGRGELDQNDNPTDCGYGAGPTWGNITGGHKQGKNVIATANLNYRGEVMGSSSRGPARDGRIKPDIAANGNNHVSTAEAQAYFSFGGTSAAAPVIAGVMAMLHEAHEALYGTRAEAALLKAVMLNTANDLGNKGPDFIYGWGSLNAHRAALSLEEGHFLKGEVGEDEVVNHTIIIPENVTEVKIMTYWHDQETPSMSQSVLLNDINTELTSASGDSYLPWLLNSSPNPILLNAPATKGVDFLNNMEQIAIDNPEAGGYTLEVSGEQIPFGVHEYYVTWEFRMNEIDIIFPDGGENLNNNSAEVIHWDATGNEGDFVITHIDSDGNETQIGQASGNRRYFEWNTPNTFSEKSRIRVSRNGLFDESTETFLLANNPRNLRLTRSEDENSTFITWQSDSIAVSYNIYLLGEFVMEKVATTEELRFDLPNEPKYKGNWIAVSANFPDGTEGKRSRAISTLPPPQAKGVNNVNDKPCIFEPVVFESLTSDTLLSFDWQFGLDAFPPVATTRGPHSVVYSRKGPNLASLIVENDGGEDNTVFILIVQDELPQSENEVERDGESEFSFRSTINGADTYTWDFGDGNTATGKAVSHIYENSGTYTVTLEAENACGVVTETSQVVVSLTNVEDLTEKDFAISPNPNQGDFKIALPDLEGNGLIVSLLGIDGRLIEQKNYSSTVSGQRIGWNAIPSGMYFLKFSVGTKEITKKLIVE